MATIGFGTTQFGPTPQPVTCTHCQAQGTTQVRDSRGLFPWLLCGGMALLGCWLCCWIPLCLQCRDAEHYCPSCHRFVGIYVNGNLE